MPLPPPKERTSYGTYLYFEETGTLKKFLRIYRQILMDNFQKVRIEDAGNITAAIRTTIQGIGTGNPGSISSSFVENGAWMI
jgi:predicted oxidoreductase (fatty acid repression mutant protein)